MPSEMSASLACTYGLPILPVAGRNCPRIRVSARSVSPDAAALAAGAFAFPPSSSSPPPASDTTMSTTATSAISPPMIPAGDKRRRRLSSAISLSSSNCSCLEPGGCARPASSAAQSLLDHRAHPGEMLTHPGRRELGIAVTDRLEHGPVLAGVALAVVVDLEDHHLLGRVEVE